MKYPRTPHLPWSPGATPDDIRVADLSRLSSGEVVVTEKRDGENTTIHQGGCHARSLDSKAHVSRDWVRALAARISPELPDGWRICGENLYAQHSIGYQNLDSYFEVFSLWDREVCMDWDTMVEYCGMLNLQVVPVLYRGVYPGESGLNDLWAKQDPNKVEGYVVRTAGCIHYQDFSKHVAKFVRANHVQTDTHWMNQTIVPNGLRG